MKYSSSSRASKPIQRDHEHQQEGRNRRFEQPLRQHADQQVLALAQVDAEEPLQGDVAAVQRGQRADARNE